jgi:hypothetical protein
MKKIGLFAFLALVLALSSVYAVFAQSGTSSKLEELLPLDRLPQKLVVGVASGTDRLYEENDVAYAIAYLDPPETNLMIYELDSEATAEAFFHHIYRDILDREGNRTTFHEMPAYVARSTDSFYHYWQDGNRVYAIEIIRNQPLTGTDTKAAALMAELLYQEKSGAGGFPIVFVIIPVVIILIAAAFVFFRRRAARA